MIIDLDSLKSSGISNDDLDVRIARIMDLPEMCDGEYLERYRGTGWAHCGECQYYSQIWQVPHVRIPLPYSSDLTASREVLKWLAKRDVWFGIKGPEYNVTLARGHTPEISINFTDLSDEPLALALAVIELCEEKK